MPPRPMAPLLIRPPGCARAALEACFEALCRLGHPRHAPRGVSGTALDRAYAPCPPCWVSRSRSRSPASLSASPRGRRGGRDTPRRCTASPPRGPLAPARPSIRPQVSSARDCRPPATLCQGRGGRRPRPRDAGGAPASSRRVVCAGTATTSCSPQASRRRRPPDGQPPLGGTRHPPLRPRGPVGLTPLQGPRGTRTRGSGRFGPTRVVPAGLRLGPCWWQRPPGGDHGVPRAGASAPGDGPLAGLDVAPTAPPWPCHPHRRPTGRGNPSRLAHPPPSPWPQCGWRGAATPLARGLVPRLPP